MPRKRKKTLEPGHLQEAVAHLQGLLDGTPVHELSDDNPLAHVISSLVAAPSYGSLEGYGRGREYTREELWGLPIGTPVWVHWCKDGNPENCRFNGAYPLKGRNEADQTMWRSGSL
jgi:hypothetical protein